MELKANSIMKEKLDVEEQIESLLSERNVRANDMSFSRETVGKDHSVDERSQAAMLSAVTSKPEPKLPGRSSNSISTDLTLILPSNYPSSRNDQSLDNHSKTPSSITPHVSAASMFKAPSLTASTYVPPTPRTKQLHLKLGTSLLNKRKGGSVKPTASPSDHGDVPSPHVGGAFIQTSSSSVINEAATNSCMISSVKATELETAKKKSFKLGLPSLFGKKKRSSDAGGMPSKEESLAKTPTLPHKEKEGGDNVPIKERAEKHMDVMDVEEVTNKERSESKLKESSSIVLKGSEEFFSEEFDAEPGCTALITSGPSAVISTHPTVEEITQQTCSNRYRNMLPKLPGVSNMLQPRLAPTKPEPTPRVSANPMDISPTPSPKERSQALCDQKRKAGVLSLEAEMTTRVIRMQEMKVLLCLLEQMTAKKGLGKRQKKVLLFRLETE